MVMCYRYATAVFVMCYHANTILLLFYLYATDPLECAGFTQGAVCLEAHTQHPLHTSTHGEHPCVLMGTVQPKQRHQHENEEVPCTTADNNHQNRSSAIRPSMTLVEHARNSQHLLVFLGPATAFPRRDNRLFHCGTGRLCLNQWGRSALHRWVFSGAESPGDGIWFDHNATETRCVRGTRTSAPCQWIKIN